MRNTPKIRRWAMLAGKDHPSADLYECTYALSRRAADSSRFWQHCVVDLLTSWLSQVMIRSSDFPNTITAIISDMALHWIHRLALLQRWVVMVSLDHFESSSQVYNEAAHVFSYSRTCLRTDSYRVKYHSLTSQTFKQTKPHSSFRSIPLLFILLSGRPHRLDYLFGGHFLAFLRLAILCHPHTSSPEAAASFFVGGIRLRACHTLQIFHPYSSLGI